MMDIFAYPPSVGLTYRPSPKPKPAHSHAHSFPTPSSSSAYNVHNPSQRPSSSNNHASSSRYPNPTSIILSNPQTIGSSSHNTGKRPKLAKKAVSSTNAKQRGVQASLEAQVEKCRGWQAFFLPAKPVPSVPPSSPVLGATRILAVVEDVDDMELDLDMGDSDLSRTTSNSSHHPGHHCVMGLPAGFGTEAMQLHSMAQAQRGGSGSSGKDGMKGEEYFVKQWNKREEWVEDVGGQSMDVDMS